MTAGQVAGGVRELDALSQAVVADLDETNGGIGWWKTYDMSLTDRWDLSDYLIDVINGAAQNLQIADFLLREYRTKRSTADFRIRDRMRRNNGNPIGRGLESVEDKEIDLRLKSYVYSFFAASSSVLDTLAGTVVGVAALDLPIVRADLRMFSPFVVGENYPTPKTQLFKSLDENTSARSLQLGLVHAFRTSILQAGPADWYVWLERKRNQLSHRGGRLQVSSFQRQRRGLDQNRFRLMERDPELTTVQDLRKDASTLEASHLMEDELSIMQGLLASLNAAVIGTLVPARSLWEQRRAAPAHLIQPATQWKSPRPGINFPGYEPQGDLLKGVSSVIVSPTDAARMAAARLLP